MSGPLAVEAHWGRKTVTRRLIKHGVDDPVIYDEGYDEKGQWWVLGEKGPLPNHESAALIRPKYNVGDWCYIREPFTARAWKESDVGILTHKDYGVDGEFWRDLPKPIRKPEVIEWICFRGDMSFWYPVPSSDDIPLNEILACFSRADQIDAEKNHRWYAGRFMPKWMSRTLVRIADVRPQLLKEITEEDARLEGFPFGMEGTQHQPSAKTAFYTYWDSMHADGYHGVDQNPWVWRYEWQLAAVEPGHHWPDTQPGARLEHAVVSGRKIGPVYRRGAQIMYVPLHVRQSYPRNEWVSHNDSELGFVWKDEGDTVLCRYWSKHHPEMLRTRANSERCDKSSLFYHISVDDKLVKHWLNIIRKEGDHSMPKFG